MNYLVSSVDCELNFFEVQSKSNCCGEQANFAPSKIILSKILLKSYVPYSVQEIDNQIAMCVAKNKNTFYINFYEAFNGFATAKNFARVKFGCDNFLFLFFQNEIEPDFRTFKFSTKQVLISLQKELTICVDEKQVVHKSVENIKFSHYEIEGQICYIFFEGKKNFLVCLKNDELVWADYFDEYNCEKDERQILKHLNDGLNHGRVLSVKQNEVEKYLVYLDDYEMNLKPEFLALVFMDCLKAENYKYCLNLVDKSICFNKDNIKEFFPEFDEYFPFNATTIALFKKNALVGICEFEIVDDKIVNIILD